MMENHKAGEVFRGMMKNNRDIGRSFGLDSKKEVVVGIMGELGIKQDVSKLKGYQQKEFLKRIDKAKDLGFYAKEALHGALEEKKQGSAESKTKAEVKTHSRYDETMKKGRERNQAGKINDIPNTAIKPVSFLVSNGNLRKAEGLINGLSARTVNNHKPGLKPTDKENSVKNRLTEIQS